MPLIHAEYATSRPWGAVFRWWVVGLGGLWSWRGRAWAQPVSAQLDRDVIYEGETVNLSIRVEGPWPEMDPGPLTRDFAILSTTTDVNFTQINGAVRQVTTRRIELEPKRSGRLTVPALRVGTRQTQPLTMTVLTGNPAPTADQGREIFLEVSAEPLDPYIQSQVFYVQRLWVGIPLLGGSLEAPGVVDAAVERLGEDRESEATRFGRRYRVFERRYGIFPQKSGQITIPAVTFKGRIAQSGGRLGGMDRFFNRGRPVTLESEAITLQVRQRPAGFSGAPFLPAGALTLEERWSEVDEPRVGEPITRTVILEAQGLEGVQLPTLDLPLPDAFKAYADQPQVATREDGRWFHGRREQRVALVPSAPGEYTLPAVTLPWWDTVQDRQRMARLPARTVTVLPAVAPGPSPTSPPAPPAPAEVAPPSPALPGEGGLGLAPPGGITEAFWYWFSLGVMGLWLMTLLGWWNDRRRPPRGAAADQANPRPGQGRMEPRWQRALAAACGDDDPQGAASALLRAGADRWQRNPPTSLGELAARLQEPAASLVRELDRALYAPNANPWRGEGLAGAIAKGLPVAKAFQADHSAEPLAPLYPRRA